MRLVPDLDDDDRDLDWDGILARSQAIIHQRGPRELAQLLLELRDEGFWIPPDAVVGIDEMLMNDDDLYDLRDRRYCRPVDLVEGRWFAHWLQHEEVVDGMLPLVPDFSALGAIGSSWRLPGDGRLELVHLPEMNERVGLHHRLTHEETGVVIGAPGWLSAAPPGHFVAVAVQGDRADVQFIESWRDVDGRCSEVQAMRDAFDHCAWYEGVAHLRDVLLTLLIDQPDMFHERPLSISELVRSAYLHTDEDRLLWADIPRELYRLAEARASGRQHGMVGCDDCGGGPDAAFAAFTAAMQVEDPAPSSPHT